MGIIHLEGSRLAEYVDGTLDERGIRRHVESCPLCQARIGDERLVRILLSGAGDPRREHLDDDELAAYVDQRLPAEESAAIDRHLAACDDCLKRWLELRALVAVEPSRVVPPHVLEQARKTLMAARPDPPTRFDLGILYITFQGKLANLLHVPPPAPVDAVSMSYEPGGAWSLEADSVPLFLRTESNVYEDVEEIRGFEFDLSTDADEDDDEHEDDEGDEDTGDSLSRRSESAMDLPGRKAESKPGVVFSERSAMAAEYAPPSAPVDDLFIEISAGLELRIRAISFGKFEASVVESASGDLVEAARLEIAYGPTPEDIFDFGGPEVLFPAPEPGQTRRLRVLAPVECEIELKIG